MRRALSGLCLAAILAAAACGGNAGATTSAASSARGAQQPAAATQAPAAAPSPSSSASATPPQAANASTASTASTAIDPAKATADAAASLSGSSSEAATTGVAAGQPAPAPSAAAAPTAAVPPAAPATSTAAAAAAPESPDAARKRAQIDWALKQDEIKNDPNGQWAVEAKASSSYNDAQGTAPFAAAQATGVPNVEALGNSGMAWATKTPDGGIEWLELKYAKPVFATAVRIRESLGPGAIIKVELYDEKGTPHTVWSGADATKGLDYLVVEFQKSAFKTDHVKLTLATNVVPGWQEIDAVQLVGSDQGVTTTAAAR